jgi:hypothetical protein
MTTAVELLRQGRRAEFWQRHCGFFDLSTEEFMAIQERLLVEQLHLLAGSELGRKIIGSKFPLTMDEFRRVAPITLYKDYAPYLLEQREDVLPVKPVCWVRTSGSSGTGEIHGKWIPATPMYYSQISKVLVTSLTLASAKHKGDIVLEEGDTVLYTAAPPPYLTGTMMRAQSQEFPFTSVPPIAEAEKMGFQERIQEGFMRSIGSGMDFFMGLASVLVRIGESLASGSGQLSFSPRLLQPMTAYRVGKAVLSSRLNNRPVLPRDIWHPKGVAASGMDVQVYRQRIKELWGRDPSEVYACTEFGPIAFQAWGERKPSLTCVPDTGFWEFMPIAEYRAWRQDASVKPKTLLLNEVLPGEYVLVATSFGGGAFIRYVIGDLIRVVALSDDQHGINLPQIVVESRVDDVINLGSMVLLTERTIWQAISVMNLGTVNWIARKQYNEDHGGPTLHVYIEGAQKDASQVETELDEALIETHEEYASFHAIMGVNPIKVSVLAPGSFEKYMEAKQAEGADPGQLKPPRMQPPAQSIDRLLAISAKLEGGRR